MWVDNGCGKVARKLLTRGRASSMIGPENGVASVEDFYEKLAEGVKLPEEEVVERAAATKHKPKKALGKDREYLPLDHEKYKGIAEAKGYAQGEDFSGNRLKIVHYSHEAMIDVLIAEPTITQNELALRFGKSRGWISIVMGSDAFQGALAKRRDDLMNPEIIASLEERYKGLADQSLRVLSEKLDATQSPDLALKCAEIAGKALGFGARGPGTVNNNATFVVALPPKMADSGEWAEKHMKSANPLQIEGP